MCNTLHIKLHIMEVYLYHFYLLNFSTDSMRFFITSGIVACDTFLSKSASRNRRISQDKEVHDGNCNYFECYIAGILGGWGCGWGERIVQNEHGCNTCTLHCLKLICRDGAMDCSYWLVSKQLRLTVAIGLCIETTEIDCSCWRVHRLNVTMDCLYTR